MDPVESGTVVSGGHARSNLRLPARRSTSGIALVTEDRQTTGLALRLPIAHNVTMAERGASQPGRVLDIRSAETARRGDYIATAAHSLRGPRGSSPDGSAAATSRRW